jgi:hypothetical protein
VFDFFDQPAPSKLSGYVLFHPHARLASSTSKHNSLPAAGWLDVGKRFGVDLHKRRLAVVGATISAAYRARNGDGSVA